MAYVSLPAMRMIYANGAMIFTKDKKIPIFTYYFL